MNNNYSASAKIAQRLLKMGLCHTLPEFPPAGVSLLELAPWWRLWLRDPRRNELTHHCAAVFPVVASNLIAFNQSVSASQAILASLLPLYEPATTIPTFSSLVCSRHDDDSAPAPGSLFSVLEHCVQGFTPADKASFWKQILNCNLQKGGKFLVENDVYNVGLLETIGRTGLAELAPRVSEALKNEKFEMVLGGIACLVRLGAPNDALPTELLLNLVRPEMVEGTRWALALVESGELDLISGLMKSRSWEEQVQALRLVEAILLRKLGAGPLEAQWQDCLVDHLLAQWNQTEDQDVVRNLTVTLGLALRGGSQALLLKIIDTLAGQQNDHCFECMLNALLVAGVSASLASHVEALRGVALKFNASSVRALNRVLMGTGETSGTLQDWVDPDVIALLQIGVLQVPDAISPWFACPIKGEASVITALLLDKADSTLAGALCASYLAAHPEYIKILEQIWLEAAYGKLSQNLKIVGGLLAGAADDCGVSPVELRCCLGHQIGGPVEESPEMVGQLLALIITQGRDIRRSAEALLGFASPAGRTIAGYCLRWQGWNTKLFDERHLFWSRFGPSLAPLLPADAFPPALQPLFIRSVPAQPNPKGLLAAMALADKQSKNWLEQCLDWDRPEAVASALATVDATTLAMAFLQVTASPHPEARCLGGLLAAGVGQQWLEIPGKDLIIQRIIYLAAHDPSLTVRQAGVKAAQALRVTQLIPVTPPPPPPKPEAQGADPDEEDQDLDEFLNELAHGI